MFLLQMLVGEDEVFVEQQEVLGNWYCMLISRLLYQHPTVKSFDLQYHTQVSAQRRLVACVHIRLMVDMGSNTFVFERILLIRHILFQILLQLQVTTAQGWRD